MEELTDEDKSRLANMIDDLGYERPDEITIDATRAIIAEAMLDDEAAFSVDQLEAIADQVFEALPEADEDDDGEEEGEDDAEEGDES